MLDYNGKSFCHMVTRRVHSDRDAVIAVTGDEGEGKSNLSEQIAQESDKKFDIETDSIITTSSDELKKKILDGKKYSAIIVDEAIKQLYKHNWQSKSQKFLNQLYTLCRQENKITILTIPRFIDLNEFFRNHRVKFWVHIIQRGTAVVFNKDWSPFTKDPWWMVENQKLIDMQVRYKSVSDVNVESKVKILSKSKNYLLSLTFSDFNPGDKEKYLNTIAKYKYEANLKEDADDLTESDALKKERIKKLKLMLLLKEKGITGAEIAKRLGVGASSICEAMRNFKLKMDEEHPQVLLNKTNNPKKLNFLHKVV